MIALQERLVVVQSAGRWTTSLHLVVGVDVGRSDCPRLQSTILVEQLLMSVVLQRQQTLMMSLVLIVAVGDDVVDRTSQE